MKKLINNYLNLMCFTVVGFVLSVNYAKAGPIDLNTWSEIDSNGNWEVSSDGSSVVQTSNSSGTIFISSDSFINSKFVGTFTVETNVDDDFIGFVFGYNNVDDFYIFDWKQREQPITGRDIFEGFTLSKVSIDAAAASGLNLWDHTGLGISVLDTQYGGHEGWDDYVTYDFILDYTDTSIEILINGGIYENENIFSLTGLTNNAGSFGFYNLSQQTVRYTASIVEAEAVPEPSTLIVFILGLIGLVISKRKWRGENRTYQ